MKDVNQSLNSRRTYWTLDVERDSSPRKITYELPPSQQAGAYMNWQLVY